jgi:hypothetical protein
MVSEVVEQLVVEVLVVEQLVVELVLAYTKVREPLTTVHVTPAGYW